MTHKLIDTLERDIRNQITINNMLRLNRKQKIMVQLRKHLFEYTALVASLVLIASVTLARAEDRVLHASDVAAGTPEWTASKTQCPTPEPCKVLILSQSEEKLLMQQNGILDTAAQARSLDLGQFAVYLKTRIAAAPAGENPKPGENKPAAPVDTPPK